MLVSELSVPSLHRARRQLELIKSQDLGSLELRVVINRFEKGMRRMVRPGDVREALGRDGEPARALGPQRHLPGLGRANPAVGDDDVAQVGELGKAEGLLVDGLLAHAHLEIARRVTEREEH